MRGLTSVPLAGALLGAALLSACSPGQELTVESGLLSAQRAKDAEARVLKASICAMSIGAYHRINTDLERRALDVLCGGDAVQPQAVELGRPSEESGSR